MPEIGRDKGIIYFIHLEAVGRQRHSLPHVHARYQNTEISIDFDGNIIAGELIPERKEKEAIEWVLVNIELCKSKWNEYCGGERK